MKYTFDVTKAEMKGITFNESTAGGEMRRIQMVYNKGRKNYSLIISDKDYCPTSSTCILDGETLDHLYDCLRQGVKPNVYRARNVPGVLHIEYDSPGASYPWIRLIISGPAQDRRAHYFTRDEARAILEYLNIAATAVEEEKKPSSIPPTPPAKLNEDDKNFLTKVSSFFKALRTANMLPQDLHQMDPGYLDNLLRKLTS